jgi:predicted flap endonuclease-1-like 5' DNA nuclease
MNNIPCILIPLLVGAICGLLGYLLGRMFSKSGDNSNELSLQAQLDACLANSKSQSLKMASFEANAPKIDTSIPKVEAFVAPNVQFEAKEKAAPKTKTTTSKAVVNEAYDIKAVADILGKRWKQDDLKIVEGIGPKIEELYHAAGIKTWAALAETPTKTSQAILTAAGDKYKMHNPGSWAKQSKMAAEGKWKALKKWQDEHKGGKE